MQATNLRFRMWIGKNVKRMDFKCGARVCVCVPEFLFTFNTKQQSRKANLSIYPYTHTRIYMCIHFWSNGMYQHNWSEYLNCATGNNSHLSKIEIFMVWWILLVMYVNACVRACVCFREPIIQPLLSMSPICTVHCSIPFHYTVCVLSVAAAAADDSSSVCIIMLREMRVYLC